MVFGMEQDPNVWATPAQRRVNALQLKVRLHSPLIQPFNSLGSLSGVQAETVV